jgi:hypothetical protein
MQSIVEALADYLAYQPFDPVIGPKVEALFYDLLDDDIQPF